MVVQYVQRYLCLSYRILSDIAHQTSDIRHRASDIRHRASYIRHHTSDTLSDIIHQTLYQTSYIRHSIRHPIRHSILSYQASFQTPYQTPFKISYHRTILFDALSESNQTRKNRRYHALNVRFTHRIRQLSIMFSKLSLIRGNTPSPLIVL